MNDRRDRVRRICHGVHLPALLEARQVSASLWRALCPFHDDKTPSLTCRYQERSGWRWRCWSCSIGGSAIDLLRQRDGMPWRQALDALDGGEALPPPPRRARGAVLVCDACRDERLEVREAKGVTLAFETLCRASAAGWEVAPDLAGAVGPRCLAKALDERPRFGEAGQR